MRWIVIVACVLLTIWIVRRLFRDTSSPDRTGEVDAAIADIGARLLRELRLAERLQRPATLHPLQHVAIGILWEQAEAILAALTPSKSVADLDRTIRETCQLLDQAASCPPCQPLPQPAAPARARGRDDLLPIIEERKVELARIIGRLEQQLDRPGQTRVAVEGVHASILMLTRLSQFPVPRGGSQQSAAASRDPYEVLGLERSASQDEISIAYRRLAALYHPDKVSHLAPEIQTLANTRMREINAAYETLSGPAR